MIATDPASGNEREITLAITVPAREVSTVVLAPREEGAAPTIIRRALPGA